MSDTILLHLLSDKLKSMSNEYMYPFGKSYFCQIIGIIWLWRQNSRLAEIIFNNLKMDYLDCIIRMRIDYEILTIQETRGLHLISKLVDGDPFSDIKRDCLSSSASSPFSLQPSPWFTSRIETLNQPWSARGVVGHVLHSGVVNHHRNPSRCRLVRLRHSGAPSPRRCFHHAVL